MEKASSFVHISKQRRARSAILGAMIGDSIGSTVEFMNGNDAKAIIAKHFEFINGLVGGGPFNLLPGQITDDSELALAIMSVVIKMGNYRQDMVANAYHSWYLSKPFDIGNATKNTVSNKSLISMLHAAYKLNSTSMSNGYLMRLFGLVALYHSKNETELIQAIKMDVALTHSYEENFHIAIIYGLMLYKSIQGYNAAEVYSWGQKNCKYSELITSIYYAVDTDNNTFIYRGDKYSLSQIDSNIGGFVGFALFLLIQSLKHQSSYQSAILNVIKYGGDTDTNACIVGAVIGALYPDTIPQKWIDSVTGCNANDRYKNYPIANPMVWIKWLPYD